VSIKSFPGPQSYPSLSLTRVALILISWAHVVKAACFLHSFEEKHKEIM